MNISEEGRKLAFQAIREKKNGDNVMVICPKCLEHPKVEISLKGERTVVSCKCGYVATGEIYF